MDAEKFLYPDDSNVPITTFENIELSKNKYFFKELYLPLLPGHYFLYEMIKIKYVFFSCIFQNLDGR